MKKFQNVSLSVALLVVLLVAGPAMAIVVGGAGSAPDPTWNGNAMQLWLRADAGVDNPDGLVGTWSDQSTHGNDAVSDDDAIKPTHVTAGGFGGRDVLRFIDSGERMRLPAGLSSAFAGDFTMFALVAPNDGDPNRDELWFGVLDESGGGNSRFFQGSDGNGNPHGLNSLYKAGTVNSGNANINPSPIPDGAPSGFTLVSYVSAANATVDVYADYANGSDTGTASAAAVNNGDFNTGASRPCVGAACFQADGFAWPNSGNTLKGDLAEIIIYQGALSTGDRQLVEAWLLGIPEPGSIALLATGCLTLLARRRRS